MWMVAGEREEEEEVVLVVVEASLDIRLIVRSLVSVERKRGINCRVEDSH